MALAAIKHHFQGEKDERATPTLECLWLLHSGPVEKEPDAPYQSSYQNALQLETTYRPRLRYIERLAIQDSDDPEEVFRRARDAYWRAGRLKLLPDQVIADMSGGTKSMTIGLAYAGVPTARDLQFMKPRQYTPSGYAVAGAGSDARRIDVSWVIRRSARD